MRYATSSVTSPSRYVTAWTSLCYRTILIRTRKGDDGAHAYLFIPETIARLQEKSHPPTSPHFSRGFGRVRRHSRSRLDLGRLAA
jgi:hypothetical protein